MTQPEPAKVITQLNEHLGIPGRLRFEPGPGGLTQAVLHTPPGHEARILLHGAHVTHYQPAGHQPVLFMSGQSHYEPGKPIRGGVPICFPWFANHATHADAPMHGFARIMPWKVQHTHHTDEHTQITLVLRHSPRTQEHFPAQFVATFTLTLRDHLSMALTTKNLNPPTSTSDEPRASANAVAHPLPHGHGSSSESDAFRYEAALHTYFAVHDVRNVRIHGLGDRDYIDKTDQFAKKTQSQIPLCLDGETDRVYLDTTDTCTIDDPDLSRRITIGKQGSHSTIVWNPWIDKAARMPDFGDDEWPRMLCVETANVADHAITLRSGESHTLTATLQVDAI